MILGHAAGAVASLAASAAGAGAAAANVHAVPLARLRARLLREHAKLDDATPPPTPAVEYYGCKAQRCVPLAAKAAHSDPRCGGECGPLAAGEWLALKQFFTVDAAASPPTLLCHTNLNLTYLKKSEVTFLFAQLLAAPSHTQRPAGSGEQQEPAGRHEEGRGRRHTLQPDQLHRPRRLVHPRGAHVSITIYSTYLIGKLERRDVEY